MAARTIDIIIARSLRIVCVNNSFDFIRVCKFIYVYSNASYHFEM